MQMTDIIDALRSLGFRASKAALGALLSHATTSRLSPAEVLEQLCAQERRERDALNLQRRTKIATIGKHTGIDAFDWAHPRAIDRALYEQLSALDFLAKGENVLLRGPSGVGKTMLAQNLGIEALRRGHTVRFTTLAAAMADLLRQESIPAVDRRLRRYTHPQLLIIDELGYLPHDGRAADMLYNIISRRHESRSTVITTNLSFKEWAGIFPGAACVVAMVDRFVQHCHVIDIDADSWRQKRSDRTPQSPRKGRKP